MKGGEKDYEWFGVGSEVEGVGVECGGEGGEWGGMGE